MEFKGTKGKWDYEKKDQMFSIFKKSTKGKLSDKDNTICGIWSIKKVDKANALLISKAPEMLKMLKKLLINIDELELSNNDVEIIVPIMAEAEQLIKEATEI